MGQRAARQPSRWAAMLALLLGVTACSGAGPDRFHQHRDDAKSSHTAPAATGGPKRLPPGSRFPVPKGFDNTRGWTEAVAEPDSKTHGSWAVAARRGLFIQVMNSAGKVHARRLAGGKEVWTFSSHSRLTDAQTDVYTATRPDGREIAVIVRHGQSAATGLDRARSLLTVDTVATDSTGSAKALHHREYQDGEAGAFTDGLLITKLATAKLLALDPFTGKDHPVEPLGETPLTTCRKRDLPPSASCSADTKAEFTTPHGVVSSYAQDSYCDFRWKDSDFVPCAEGFTVGRSWRSERFAPRHAANATPLAVVGDYIVVDWTLLGGAASEEQAKRDIVAVHRLKDGSVAARTDCDITGTAGNASARLLAAQTTSQLSPNGGFLVSGQVGFDLTAKRGWCLADNARKRGVTLTAVSDEGQAYGVSYTESTWSDVPYGAFPHDFGSAQVAAPAQAVAVDLHTGKARPLGRDTALPVRLFSGTGLFLTSGTLAAYPALTR